MKAYNEQWIFNRDVLAQANRWHRQQLLTDAQLAAVEKDYPSNFRQTNGFLEIGLFLFTTVAILACYLLPISTLSLLLSDSPTAYGLFNLLTGVIIGVVGQLIINRRLLYRNGIDNAFVVTMAGFLAFGLNQLLPNTLSLATNCFLTLPILLLILWYYGDTLIAFFVLATFYTGVFDALLSYSWGRNALPFVVMAVSLFIYAAAVWYQKSYPKQRYYADPVNLAQWFSLLMLAAAGNYFVVREVNGLINFDRPGGPAITDAPELALPVLFWVLTFLTPAVYIWFGLLQKNRMLLILGALGLVAAVSIVYEFTDFVPLNVLLTLSGLALIGTAVAGIQYLKAPKHGFTDAPDDDSPNEFFTNAATAVAVQATGAATQSPKDNLRFGGGNFGGGGSGGKGGY